jgi:hypothetical protein
MHPALCKMRATLLMKNMIGNRIVVTVLPLFSNLTKSSHFS